MSARLDDLLLFDVGARGGLHPRWRGRGITAVGFDADAAECARLNAAQQEVRYLPYCVGATDGQAVTLHVTNAPGCSSLLEPNMAFCEDFHFGRRMRVEERVRMATTTLRTICAREGLSAPAALKLDVQGAELDVLTGLGGALADVLLVEAEVEFNEQYQRQPLFGDVDRYLRPYGFILLGLRLTSWRRRHPTANLARSAGGTLVHGDALWVRDPYTLRTADEVLALCRLAAAYDQDDLVGQLLLEPHPAVASITEDGRRALWSQLCPRPSWLQRAAGAFLGQFGSHRAWRERLDALRAPGASDWHGVTFY